MHQGAVVFPRPPTHLGLELPVPSPVPRPRDPQPGPDRDPTEDARVSPAGVHQCLPPRELYGLGYVTSDVPSSAIQPCPWNPVCRCHHRSGGVTGFQWHKSYPVCRCHHRSGGLTGLLFRLSFLAKALPLPSFSPVVDGPENYRGSPSLSNRRTVKSHNSASSS